MLDRTGFSLHARRWPLLALCVLLATARSGASAPVDVSPTEVSSSTPREAMPTEFWRSNDARRAPASSGKVRIGRIFFSPAERRQRRAVKAPADASMPSRATRAERLIVSGAVSSSTQGRALWINGAAVENSATVWTDRAGRVWLRDDTKTPHLARPGQAINPATGAMEDLLPAGAVVRR